MTLTMGIDIKTCTCNITGARPYVTNRCMYTYSIDRR